MGKGDKKTKRGKIIMGSYGIPRPGKTIKKVPAVKTEKVDAVVQEKVEKKKTKKATDVAEVIEEKTEVKKSTSKKAK